MLYAPETGGVEKKDIEWRRGIDEHQGQEQEHEPGWRRERAGKQRGRAPVGAPAGPGVRGHGMSRPKDWAEGLGQDGFLVAGGETAGESRTDRGERSSAAGPGQGEPEQVGGPSEARKAGVSGSLEFLPQATQPVLRIRGKG